MPNWCENDLTISGPAKKLDELCEFVKGNDADEIFDFNKIIPYPQQFLDMDAELYRIQGRPWVKGDKGITDPMEREKALAEYKKKYNQNDNEFAKDGFNSGGYEWCIANWGTKWNACDVQMDRQLSHKLFYFMTTAWAPPCPVILALSEKFPDLKFTLRYYECGAGYSGCFKAKGGKTLEDSCNTAYHGHRGG